MYTGYITIQPDDEKLALLYEGKNTDYNFLINQYVIIQDAEGKVIDKRRWDGDKLVPLSYVKIKDFKPMTPKQECLCDMLSNPNLSIRIVAGVAGSGKTKIVMTHGLHYVFRQVYNRFFLVRHNVSVGEKNGYLPGNKFDKIRGWLGFFEDNLDSVQYTIEELFERGMLDVDSPEYLKGRDLKNSWILVDECEDLTEEQFRMIGERISAGSVMCFVGDYEQTTQEKYKKFNGLKRAIESLKGLPQVGIMVFDDVKNDNVRSEASKIFTTYY